MAIALPPPNSDTWRTGYCGCFEDFESCLCGWCCPCVLVGRVAEIVDYGATSCSNAALVYCCIQMCTGCGFLYTCGYRGRLRAKFGLPAEPCGDCCSDYWCPCCSITQQYRELLRRDINPSLGFVANRHKLEIPQGPYPPQGQYMQR